MVLLGFSELQTGSQFRQQERFPCRVRSTPVSSLLGGSPACWLGKGPCVDKRLPRWVSDNPAGPSFCRGSLHFSPCHTVHSVAYLIKKSGLIQGSPCVLSAVNLL